MGEIKISYLHDPKSGRRELWIDYESAADWMDAEHERRHKAIVRQLIDRGALDPSQIDRIYVRVEDQQVVVEEADSLEEKAPKEATANKS